MRAGEKADDPSIFSFGMKPGESGEVTARAGLPLVLEALRAVRLDEVVREHLRVAKRKRGYDELEKLEALVALIADGGDRVEDIRILSEDKGFARLVGRTLPSSDALLAFLNAFDDSSVEARRPKDELSWVPPESAALGALDTVNRALVARACDPKTVRATVDHDGTIIESHKRGAKVAYEGTRGYQPLLAVWAEEDLVLADEFRDGNVPGGKDPLTSVRRAFAALPEHVTQRYFRGDSAAYYTPLLKYLVAEKIRFSISADMGADFRARCLEVPRGRWEELERRDREVVELADVEFSPGNWPKQAEPLRYVAIRFTATQGELFSNGQSVKHLAVVTNRREMTRSALVKWHWGKAGTIEHSHRVLKDELGAGVMPCQRFGANAAWFRMNVLTYNLLSFLRRRVLPERYRDARPKRLRFDLFRIPGKLSAHGRELTVTLPTSDQRYGELVAARARLFRLRERLGTPSAARRRPARPSA